MNGRIRLKTSISSIFAKKNNKLIILKDEVKSGGLFGFCM